MQRRLTTVILSGQLRKEHPQRDLPEDLGGQAEAAMIRLLKEWRALVLVLLLVGPVLAYIGFGSIWLWEHGWLLIAAVLWILRRHRVLDPGGSVDDGTSIRSCHPWTGTLPARSRLGTARPGRSSWRNPRPARRWRWRL